MVNRDKKNPESDIEYLNIERVPTFIFYKTGGDGSKKEIGRIIETPVRSLEEDLLDILH